MRHARDAQNARYALRRPLIRAFCAFGASCASLAGTACKGPPDAIQQMTEAADSADQLMIGVEFYLTNLGVRQALVKSDTAFVYENTGITELKRVNVTFYSTSGVQTSVLDSRFGTYRARQSLMEARGNVVVVREDGARLTTQYLRFDQAKNEVSTDSSYVFVDGERRAEGQGFVSDPSFRDLRTRRVSGTGGGFALPQ